MRQRLHVGPGRNPGNGSVLGHAEQSRFGRFGRKGFIVVRHPIVVGVDGRRENLGLGERYGTGRPTYWRTGFSSVGGGCCCRCHRRRRCDYYDDVAVGHGR